MSTPNFISQKDFPLMILDNNDYLVPVCPVCGSPLDNFSNGEAIYHYA